MYIERIIKTLAVICNFSSLLFGIIACLKVYKFKSFLNHKVKKNTILVTDPIMGHGEVMPGIIKYCLDKKFNVEVLITSEKMQEKPFSMFKNLKIYSFGLNEYTNILKSNKLNDYKYIIFTSSRVYYNYSTCGEQFVFDYFKDCKVNPKKTLLIEHHLDLLSEKEKENFNFAGLPEFSKNYGIKMINPHFFGNYKTKSKHKIVNFIVAGSIEQNRKNHYLITDAIKNLLNKNFNNFKITVVGGGKLEISDANIKNQINFTGRLTYKKMYELISKSDYILGLFDPNNKLHDRYIKDGTSGTYQLAYGFLKPLIINEKFSIPYGLNNQNSLIYKDNNLSYAMEIAITESNNVYLNRIKELKQLKDKIYFDSLNNFNSFISGENNE